MKALLDRVREFVPPLTFATHKGEHGRVAVVGGSSLYTGAPFFSGISSMRVGAELVTVLCFPEATVPLKSYSPELMVSGTLPEDISILNRMDAVVIGPGLGRDIAIVEAVLREVEAICVIDGDALWAVSQKPSILNGGETLTPNSIEFKRIWESVMTSELSFGIDIPITTECCLVDQSFFSGSNYVSEVVALAKKLNVCIVRKGAVDIISDGQHVAVVDLKGSPRRCGGQGDVLAGITGVFSAWASNLGTSPVIAAAGACMVLRRAAELAFLKTKRSTTTIEIISELPRVLDEFEFN